MKLYSVLDPEFTPYGRVVTGLDEAVAEILPVLDTVKAPAVGTSYTPEDPDLQELPAMTEISEHCFGGMPVQMGHCDGHNTHLNCLEYHRSSEFNLSNEDFILLLARQEEIVDGKLETSRVKAFRCPAGTLIEVYATTLHFAPCHADPGKGFRVLVVLPQGTNRKKPDLRPKTPEDALLWGTNKWVLAHPESALAAKGAYQGLVGENIDITPLL